MPPLPIDQDVSLRALNTFGVPAKAQALVRVTGDADVRRVLDDPRWGRAPKFILGGGSNLLLARDVQALVMKVEVRGMRCVREDEHAVVVEAGAGESWHDVVAWTLDQGWPGLENLALIPGSMGAAPVQNIGAYGVELADRFDSLDAVDLVTGRSVSLDASACHFAYRDSIFKGALRGKSLITRVRLRLPRPWKAELGYLDLQKRVQASGVTQPSARQIFDWVCDIRRAKLPDPQVVGNAGSFFKNPVVSPAQCHDILSRDAEVVHYPMPDGTFKLAAAWLIDACGWKGKSIGAAGVYEKHSLVLVNRGGASGAEIVTLARAIQESVYGRFGIRLEPEPVIHP
jgi:UDP-N-acetylmuramate dehydrogenase